MITMAQAKPKRNKHNGHGDSQRYKNSKRTKKAENVNSSSCEENSSECSKIIDKADGLLTKQETTP